jgi:hypothetical protein
MRGDLMPVQETPQGALAQEEAAADDHAAAEIAFFPAAPSSGELNPIRNQEHGAPDAAL